MPSPPAAPFLSAFPITPLTGEEEEEEDAVDASALRALVERLTGAGVASIGVLGSTGSYPYLPRAERRRAAEAAVAAAGGRAEVLVGIGAMTTREVVGLAADALAAGADAGLLAPVSYQALRDDEVFTLFADVARAVPALPLVIYHNSQTTRFVFAPPLVRRLAAMPEVVAIKNPAPAGDAEGAHAAWADSAAGSALLLGYSGDARIVDALLAGGAAWYSVIGGVFPRTCLAIVDAVRRGDAGEARRLHAALAPLWALFDELSSYRVAYAIASILGLAAGARPPRPVLPLDAAATARVAGVLQELGLDAGS